MLVHDQLTPDEHDWLSRDFGLESEAAGGSQGPERAPEHAGKAEDATAPPDPGSAGGGDHAGEDGAIESPAGAMQGVHSRLSVLHRGQRPDFLEG